MTDPNYVPDKLTPLTLDQLIDALRAGYRKFFGGTEPSAKCLACLGAQLALESGNGAKAHHFNFGNRKVPKDWGGRWTDFSCDELFDEATAAAAKKAGPCVVEPWTKSVGRRADGSTYPLFRVVLLGTTTERAGHPWARFVAFEKAVDGAEDYVDFIYRKTAAWAAAYAGDPARFTHELRLARYFTADEVTYGGTLVAIFNRILPACDRVLSSLGHGLTDEDRRHVSELVALSLSDIAFVRAAEPERLE